VAGPILILALAVGLLVSIFQATTQIQEQTLAFIPKIIAVLIGVVLFGPWMLSKIVKFTADLYQSLPMLVGYKMLDYLSLSIIPSFLLVFARTLEFLMTVPLFSYRTIPNMFKIGFSFFLSIVILTSFDSPVVSLEYSYILLLLKEVTVGLAIGLIAYIILSAVQTAGGFIDFQMGFAIANVVDPQTGAQSPIIGQFFYMIALLFLLSVNGHYLLIDGLMNSYQFIPL